MMRPGKVLVALLLAISPAGPVLAGPQPLAAAPGEALAWRGEHRWRMTIGDEAATLRLGLTQTPAGDYLITGSILLDDAELGVSGSGRERDGRLIIDVIANGGVRQITPDTEKRGLYGSEPVPEQLDSAGFAAMRIELDPRSFDGVSQQYQTNVVTGDRVQGPVYRTGILQHVGRR